MKALTFEEWDEKTDCEGSADEMFAWARIGMIPEDEAVRIPPVSEWPEWAEEIRVFFSNAKDGSDHRGEFISRINRPVPAWTPKVGDAVFTLGAISGDIEVALVVSKDADGYKCKKDRNAMGWFDVEYLKPFDASKIGKPWEEI